MARAYVAGVVLKEETRKTRRGGSHLPRPLPELGFSTVSTAFESQQNREPWKYSKMSLPLKGNKSYAVPPAADLSLWNSPL